jgi:PPOX class probable F420-dependent enzyme
MHPQEHAPSTTFVDLARQWAIRLTTFRQDGTPVSTPVNIAVSGDRAFFRTYEQAGKFKRLRNDPRVLVAPSTATGAPTGPEIEARAVLLSGPDDEAAAALIDRKHRFFQRLLVRFAHRVRGYTTRHFELVR